MEPVPGNLVRDHSIGGAIGLVTEIERVPRGIHRNRREVWVVQLMDGRKVRHLDVTLYKLEVINESR